MKNRILPCLIWIFFISGCGQADHKSSSDLYSKLEAAEKKAMLVYFTKDVGSSISALNEYIVYLDSAEKQPADKWAIRFIKSGRALATTRLEFALAHVKGKKVDLRGAIKDFKEMGREMESFDEKQCAIALIKMIRDDTKRVSWLDEFDRIANETINNLQ